MTTSPSRPREFRSGRRERFSTRAVRHRRGDVGERIYCAHREFWRWRYDGGALDDAFRRGRRRWDIPSARPTVGEPLCVARSVLPGRVIRALGMRLLGDAFCDASRSGWRRERSLLPGERVNVLVVFDILHAE